MGCRNILPLFVDSKLPRLVTGEGCSLEPSFLGSLDLLFQQLHRPGAVVEDAGRTESAVDERALGAGHENGDPTLANRAWCCAQFGHGGLQFQWFIVRGFLLFVPIMLGDSSPQASEQC